MKTVKHIQDIYISKDNKDNIYLAENGLYIRDVEIDAGLGEEVLIGHLSDIHLNYCNQRDFDEADPVVMSTYENRHWCANGETVVKAQRCFTFLEDADQIVLNGDTMDYLSHGSMELMQQEVWDKHPAVIATLCGHEVARKMQGKVADPMSYEERLAILEKFWKHDIFYVSRLVKEKVLVIGMFNDLARYNEAQKQKLEADLALARQKGYVVLIFAHEPLSTGNPLYQNFTAADAMLVGDSSVYPLNLYDGKIAGSDGSDAVTKEVYSLIINNADIIKGVFAGHVHNDMHVEITAKTYDGRDTVIPQYIHTATAYDDGHLMRIVIK